jgi:hypothetical protein
LGELFLAMFRKEVILDVHEFPFFVDPFEGVAAITVIVAPPIRSAMVAEKHHTGMIGLRGQREKVKQGVIVKKKISGIPRL